MTHNETLIEALVRLADTNEHALRNGITADDIVRAIYHEAVGGAVAPDQDLDWLALEEEAIQMIIQDVDLEPGDENWAAVLHEIIRDIHDLADNAND